MEVKVEWKNEKKTEHVYVRDSADGDFSVAGLSEDAKTRLETLLVAVKTDVKWCLGGKNRRFYALHHVWTAMSDLISYLIALRNEEEALEKNA